MGAGQRLRATRVQDKVFKFNYEYRDLELRHLKKIWSDEVDPAKMSCIAPSHAAAPPVSALSAPPPHAGPSHFTASHAAASRTSASRASSSHASTSHAATAFVSPSTPAAPPASRRVKDRTVAKTFFAGRVAGSTQRRLLCGGYGHWPWARGEGRGHNPEGPLPHSARGG